MNNSMSYHTGMKGMCHLEHVLCCPVHMPVGVDYNSLVIVYRVLYIISESYY